MQRSDRAACDISSVAAERALSAQCPALRVRQWAASQDAMFFTQPGNRVAGSPPAPDLQYDDDPGGERVRSKLRVRSVLLLSRRARRWCNVRRHRAGHALLLFGLQWLK